MLMIIITSQNRKKYVYPHKHCVHSHTRGKYFHPYPYPRSLNPFFYRFKEAPNWARALGPFGDPKHESRHPKYTRDFPPQKSQNLDFGFPEGRLHQTERAGILHLYIYTYTYAYIYAHTYTLGPGPGPGPGPWAGLRALAGP